LGWAYFAYAFAKETPDLYAMFATFGTHTIMCMGLWTAWLKCVALTVTNWTGMPVFGFAVIGREIVVHFVSV